MPSPGPGQAVVCLSTNAWAAREPGRRLIKHSPLPLQAPPCSSHAPCAPCSTRDSHSSVLSPQQFPPSGYQRGLGGSGGREGALLSLHPWLPWSLPGPLRPFATHPGMSFKTGLMASNPHKQQEMTGTGEAEDEEQGILGKGIFGKNGLQCCVRARASVCVCTRVSTAPRTAAQGVTAGGGYLTF